MYSAEYLRELIHKANKTQLDVAVSIRISERQLRRYLRCADKKEPPLKVVLAIQHVLGIS